MTKSLMILPQEVRRSGAVEFDPIPVNQYARTLAEELDHFSKEDLLRIYHDMSVIRTFESMFQDVALQGNYRDLPYTHRGPAHLSIGQEASAVGQAFLLGVDDCILGSHRSHGEILAKGLSAIHKLDNDTLLRTMENYFEGKCLKVVEKDSTGGVKSLAIDYLIYGALAEIFARETGFNKGLGGSMHAFFPPFGIYPNNAIVGASCDIAVGVSLFKRINHKPGIVICNAGDSSAGCGPVWEALVFSAMDQFKTLWDETHGGGLPFILNFVNNFYGMGGQPVGETMGFKILARMGAGLNPEQMHAERVDGFNPLAVIDAIRRKKAILEQGDGPVLLDTITYRFCGHSPADASTYREKREIEAWQKFDPLTTFGESLIQAGLTTREHLHSITETIGERVFSAYKKAIDLEISPRVNLTGSGNLRERTILSHQTILSMDQTREPEVLLPQQENPRAQQLAKRSRSAFDEKGERLPKIRCIGIRDALFEAILHRFYVDPTFIAYGEDNRDWGGAFGVYRGLTESLPYHRFFNTPISEAAIVGTAVGYALAGGRVLIELMYCDFLGRAGDEVFNQLAKWQSMSGGLLKMPVVLRVLVGSMYGAQHSQEWTALCAHVPGLKVIFPATPYDAKGLMNSALSGTDPVIVFESQRLYDMPEEFVKGGVPPEYYDIPIGEPDVKKPGKDLTILTIGATLYRALEAATVLEKEHGISCEVIDARAVVPFNYDQVIDSVRKTHKILLASDGCERGNILHTMASKVTQFAFDHLNAPPVVLGAHNWITPDYQDESAFFPFPSDFVDAVHEHILPLKNHQPKGNCSNPELMRRSAIGA